MCSAVQNNSGDFDCSQGSGAEVMAYLVVASTRAGPFRLGEHF